MERLTNVVYLVTERSLVARAVGVDVCLGLFTCERDLIGCKTQKVAVLLMEFPFALGEFAG